MKRVIAKRAPSLSFSLRLKVILTFFVIISIISTAMAGVTYKILNDNLFSELQTRVQNLTEIGSHLIDRPALKRLHAQIRPDLSREEVLAIERLEDFSLISEQLNLIREADRPLVRYVYLFVQTEEENTALYLVDADVLSDIQRQEAGEQIPEGEISHYASVFDISDFPVARQAIRLKENQVETEYTYDEAFEVSSVSGYAPILDEDRITLLAVLGLDMVDSDAREVLQKASRLALAIAAVMLLITLGISVLLGTMFTRGIIHLDRVVRRFGEKDLTVRAKIKSRDEVGRLGTSFNQMADIIQQYSSQLEALLRAYGRFVPHDFLRFLRKDSILDVKLGDQVQQEMTILFSDICSFTELSEAMSPRENFNFINSYLSRVGPEIRGHGGFIDKYIGDAIMALFPANPDDAVRAAIAIRHKLVEYNQHRQSSGYLPISIGIGIHTGKLMLGTLGELERMDGSVIADAVNLCSRLEALTRFYGAVILISGPTLSLLENSRQYNHRFIDRVCVRGRKQAVLIYEICDGDPPELLEKKNKSKEQWNAAINHYYGRSFEQSYKILNSLKAELPQDKALEIYLKRCARLIREGVPENWQGVEIIDLK